MGAPLEYGAPSIAIANCRSFMAPGPPGQARIETYRHTDGPGAAFGPGVQKDVSGATRMKSCGCW
jgi:hypothetical protein